MTTTGSTDSKVEEKNSTVSILAALSDDKSLELFKIIASALADDTVYPIDSGELINTQLLISKVKLTRKQYYSRISTLISSGLVKRSNGKYLLTSLGKIAYSVTALIDQAIHDHWKLKAIDALETKSSSGIPDEEREKIVDMLVDNHELNRILNAKRSLYNETEKQMSSADKRSASAIARHPVPMRMNQILE
jgi:predicted transcriptional regulator